MDFYCSRCGARLQVPNEMTDARVKCGHCGRATRTPDATEQLPVATVLATAAAFCVDDRDARQPIDDDEALQTLLTAHELAPATAHQTEPPVEDAADELARSLNATRGYVAGA